MDIKTTTLKKHNITPESSRKPPESIPRSLPVFFTVPPTKRGFPATISVPGAQK